MRRTSCTMDGFCLLYLLMILLMRSGDVETNPGPDRIVSEEEFIKLATLIAPSYYHKLGVNLEIPIVELDHIRECSPSTSDALITVFTRWRDKQPPRTDIRALLAEGLERSDSGSLSGELLAGSLVPSRTGAPATMPGSQAQPLSPDLIKRCADDFKFKYRTTLCKIRSDPLNPDSIVPFGDMYTNLVLEEEYRQSKRPLEYRNLFDLKVNGEFPRRIMIQGEAGTGKTTFCSKIAWDWINNSPVLPNFVWVLVVPFCEAKQYTIGEIAKSYLSKDNPATASQITEYIRSNQKDVLMAFDGLDEFGGKVVQEKEAGSESECHQPKSVDQTKARSESKMNKKRRKQLMQPKSGSPSSATSQPRVNSAEASGSSSERGGIALTDILCSDELATCPVLVTSRPWKVTEIRWDASLSKQYTFLHVEGFSKENVEDYISKYFEDDVAKADQLIQLTKDNDIISKHMAPYPIYIAMLCLMWRELGNEKQEKLKSLQTFSQIFDEMFEYLKVHYAQKNIIDLDSPSFQAYCSRIEKLMEPVSKVAFIGLQENILSFKEGDFEQCSDSMETACRVGVLSQEKKLSSLYNKSSMFMQSTIFFPHKLFQEYMAGVHLASLYELDHNEFNRLIEQVVLPRKEEFRYLLYFTVSQNKSIAAHIMECMLQGMDLKEEVRQEHIDFIVDVAFESQDLDVAALVNNKFSSKVFLVTISRFTAAHTVAGYAFIRPHAINLIVHDKIRGRTTSHNVARIICSAPSLKDVTLHNASFHSDFYAVLAKEGNKSKVQTLKLDYVQCPKPRSTHHLVQAKTLKLDYVQCPKRPSSHHLVEALFSLPNLTDLTLRMDLNDEFYSTLNAKASSIQVQTLELEDGQCPTPASSHHLVEALCSMPNLTDLTLGMDLNEEFYSTLKAKASSIQVHTLKLDYVQCPTRATSHHLLEALCSMPNLTDLTLGMDLNTEFYSSLKAKASSMKVQTLKLEDVQCPTPASSHHLVEALCSMPKLTDLTLRMDLNEEFYSTLLEKASSIRVQTLKLDYVQCPTPASSHHLVEALCSMPNLSDLTLHEKDFNEEFYSTLKAKASSIQVQTLKLDYVQCPTPASTHLLAEALCSMPNLTDLTLGMNLNEEFYSTLKANASSIQVQTLKLDYVRCPTPASSYRLAEALCSMPYLTDLTLHGRDYNETFYSTLKAKASSVQVQTLKLHIVQCPTPASSHDLAEALCSMPNLTDLTLGMDLNEEFYSTLKAKASSIQVHTLQLHVVLCPTPASSHHLAEALCSMPNLTDLMLFGRDLNEEFYSTLKSKASSMKDTSSMSLNEPSGCEATPSRTETRDLQQTTEEIHAQYEFQAEDRPGRDGNQVHWDFLTDSPQELTLQDNEAVISCGIRFSPSGAKFSKPIKVTLDHNAHFSNPRCAAIVFYMRNKDSKSFERIPASTSRYPRCNVRAKDLDLYVDHFCDWWIVAVYNWCFVGKKVNCLPYVRPPVWKESYHLVYLCIYDNLSVFSEKTEKEMTGVKMIFPSQPMFVEWKHGDIDIKLFEGPRENEKKLDEKTLGKKDINLVGRKLFCFELKPLESGASPELLKFNLNQRKSCSEDLSDPTLIEFILPYDDIGTTAEAQAQAAGVSMPSRMSSMGEQDFRGILRLIAKNMRTDEQTGDLGLELGIDQDDIDGYKVANRHGIEYPGTYDMLRKWSMNQQPTKRLRILRQALETVGRIDLCESLFLKPDVVDMGTMTTAATTTAATFPPPMHAGAQAAATTTTLPSMHAGAQAAAATTTAATFPPPMHAGAQAAGVPMLSHHSQVGCALRQSDDVEQPLCGIEERGLLTYKDDRFKIWSKINEHSVGDLIDHRASTETSTQNLFLLFMAKVILHLPVRKCRRYLIELWIRFRTRNEEETERE